MIRRASILVSGLTLAACATHGAAPPQIALDPPPMEAVVTPDPPKPVQVVEIPEPLPLPGQLKPLAGGPSGRLSDPPKDPRRQVIAAGAAARVQPAPDGFINAVQIWPFSPGALYQLYASPGKVTDIALEPGEKLTSVSAGDTVRWVIGDTTSGAGAAQQVHVLVKPTRPDLKTNLLIYTDRRLYQLEMTAGPSAWMASLAWSYPQEDLVALQRGQAQAEAATPIADGVRLERLAFRYAITGDRPPWRPLNAFDDGEKVYIQFPAGIAQTDLPPLFIIGANGDAQIVNYRVRAPYYVVDGLFAAAELRLGGKHQSVVRIERTDGTKPHHGLFQ
jgi:P-type conjugative transfer protein TrbG